MQRTHRELQTTVSLTPDVFFGIEVGAHRRPVEHLQVRVLLEHRLPQVRREGTVAIADDQPRLVRVDALQLRDDVLLEHRHSTRGVELDVLLALPVRDLDVPARLGEEAAEQMAARGDVVPTEFARFQIKPDQLCGRTSLPSLNTSRKIQRCSHV